MMPRDGEAVRLDGSDDMHILLHIDRDIHFGSCMVSIGKAIHLLAPPFPFICGSIHSRVTNDGTRLVRLLEILDLLFGELKLDRVFGRAYQITTPGKKKAKISY